LDTFLTVIWLVLSVSYL